MTKETVRCLRFLRFCRLLPACGGGAILLLWMLFDRDFLIIAGLGTMALGAGLLVLGTAGALFALLRRNCPREDRRPLVKSLLLLFTNLPLGAACFAAAFIWAQLFLVLLVNGSPLPLEECRIEGGGVRIELGTLPPGGWKIRGFFIERDGGLSLFCREEGQEREFLLQGYVTNGMGGRIFRKLPPPPGSQGAP